MTARELFKGYRGNKMEIARLKSDHCHRVDMVRGSSDEAPYSEKPIRISGTDTAQLTANRIKRESLEADCAFVEAAIALAPNSQIRLILEMWAYDGMHWDEIAAKLASSGIDSSKESVKQTAYRYFKTLDEKKQQKQKRLQRKKA